MPTIRHRSGPLAGTEQSIDPRVERITFGRDPAVCDVVFPPDLTVVARRHFALVRKPSGEWLYEDFGDPYVAVNGAPAESDEAVRSGSIIELGRKGGPSFEVIFEGKDFATSLAATEVQQKVVGGRAAAVRASRMAMIGAGVAALAVIIAGVFYFTQRNDGARLEQAVAALQKAQAEQAADSISGAARERLMQAAYVVVVRYASGQWAAQGSASPIAGDMLATNAHVAELRNRLGPEDKLYVRAPGRNGKTFEVIDTIIHPGYTAFNRFLNEDPIFVTSAKDCPTCFPSVLRGSLSYDVAILRVAPDSNLGPILEVASRDELLGLKPGMPLGLAGYPLENMQGREIQGLEATPNLRTGMISALTDMFNLPAEAAQQRLIHHNIPVTGGNSGSPMIGPSGKLVALLNSGNVLPQQGGGRMPNAAIVNFAQRADFLLELLDGSAQKNLDAERAYWQKQTANFKRGFDFIVPQLLAELRPPNGATPTMVSQSKFTLTRGDQFKAKDVQGRETSRRQKIHSFNVKANQPGVFIAYAQERAPIQLYLVQNGQIIGQNDRGVWFPHVNYGFQADTDVDVYVVSPDQDVNYTLLQYNWDAPRS